MGGKTQTQTTQSGQTYTPTGLSGLQDIWSRIQQATSQPYTPYGGELVAPVNAQQQTGISNINAAYGTAQPYINQASGYAAQGAAPISSSAIQGYQNPYTQQVVNATQAQFNNSNAAQQSQLTGNAALRGALGGDRVGVAQAELAKQQNLSQNPVIANLYADSYKNALSAAQGDRAAQGQAAYTFGNLGTTAQNAALQGAQAQIGAGGLQQQTQQATDTAKYQQFLQQQAYPYQNAQFAASLGLPTLSGMGGTQTGTQTSSQPGPSPWGQGIGLALSAASLFSDKEVKENIEKVGKTFDGENIYKFNYKGDPTTHIGFIAQELEKSKPDAVGESGGVKTVNYDDATKDSAAKGKFADGGAVMPYNISDIVGYIPKTQMSGAQTPGMTPMQAPQFRQSDSGMPSASSMKDMASGMKNIGSFLGDNFFTSQGGNYDANMMGPAMTGSTGMVIGGLRNGGRVSYADGGAVDDTLFSARWAPVEAAADEFTRPAATSSPLPVINADAVGLGKPVDWSPAQQNAPAMVAAGATPETISRADIPQSASPGAPPVVNPAVADNSELPMNAMPVQYTVPQEKAKSTFGGWNPFNLSDEARSGLLAAGLGMMASKSPFALTQIGEGGLQGVKTYTEGQKTAAEQKLAKQRVDLEAQRMAQSAAQFAQNFGLHKEQFEETKREHKRAALKPIKIGTDITGTRDIYALPNPDTGELQVIDQTGKPVDPKAVVADPATTGSAAPVEIRAQAEPGSPRARNEEYLKTLEKENPGYAKQVKAAADYMLDPNKTFSMRNNVRDKFMRAVYEYDPTYDATTFPMRNRAVTEFGSGKLGNQIRSFDVSIAHLATLENLAQALKNNDSQAINKVKNYIKTQFGYEGPVNFEAAKKIVGDEIAKGIIGGQTALGDREEFAKNLNSANSPEQLAGAIRTFKQLLGGQLHGLKKQYEDTTKLKNFDDRLTPITREEIAKAEAYHAPAGGTGSAGSGSAVPAKGEIRKGHKFLGGDPSKRENWEKVP